MLVRYRYYAMFSELFLMPPFRTILQIETLFVARIKRLICTASANQNCCGDNFNCYNRVVVTPFTFVAVKGDFVTANLVRSL